MPAVDGVTLDIQEGEFFCLLGPSGCGKSTLLRLLAGFEVPDEGRILLDGQDIAGMPPHRRPLNMMFQSYALFPHLTVAGNIAFGLKRAGLRRAEIGARVDEMLALVQLSGLGSRYPGQLSGGQSQRVALARALARRPRLLLLDEPLGALDRRLREDTQLELKELQSRLGTTFVVVTHDRAEAMAMADRIAVMDRGRAIQIATPREVYDSPASRFVAAFMGDVNLVPGRLAGQDGADWLVATELARTPFRIRSDCAAPVALGDPVTLAIRPESLVLARDDADPNRIEGELAGLLYLGGSTSCRVRHRSGEILRVSVPGTGTLAELRDGAPVAIGFAPDAAKILLS